MPADTRAKRLFSALYFQVLIGIVVGSLIGHFFPHAGVALKPFGDGFIKLIKMVLGPIVFLTIVLGIARMGDIKRVGRVGLKALVYFEVVSSLALVIGLIVGTVFHPGTSMHVDPSALDANAVAAYAAAGNQHRRVPEFLLAIIPSSAIDAFARDDMLQIILFSVLFGIALSRVAARVQTLLKVLDDFLQAMFGVVRIVMRLAPVGAGGAMAFTIGSYGVASLAAYGKLIACLYVTAALFIFLVLAPIATACGISFLKFLRFIKEELLVTFGTASTEAVLPAMMAKLETLGCEQTVVGMVLPAGYGFNSDGTSIYLTMTTLFVAQAVGIHLSLMDELTVLAVALLTSKGIAGVAGGGFIALAATLSSTNKVPVAALVLVFGIDRILDEARAVTNLIGNGIATVAVSKWEGQFDQKRATVVLNERAESPAAVSSVEA
jgi:aerobic C4-dicarboxylate transport protein